MLDIHAPLMATGLQHPALRDVSVVLHDVSSPVSEKLHVAVLVEAVTILTEAWPGPEKTVAVLFGLLQELGPEFFIHARIVVEHAAGIDPATTVLETVWEATPLACLAPAGRLERAITRFRDGRSAG